MKTLLSIVLIFGLYACGSEEQHTPAQQPTITAETSVDSFQLFGRKFAGGRVSTPIVDQNSASTTDGSQTAAHSPNVNVSPQDGDLIDAQSSLQDQPNTSASRLQYLSQYVPAAICLTGACYSLVTGDPAGVVFGVTAAFGVSVGPRIGKKIEKP